MYERKDLSRLGLAACIVLVGFSAQAQPLKVWTRTIGETIAGNSGPDVVSTDSAGNTFVAKTRGFRGTEGGYGFSEVTKHSPSGTTFWTVLTAGGLGTTYGGLGIAVSSTNRLHVVGTNVGAGSALADFTLAQYGP